MILTVVLSAGDQGSGEAVRLQHLLGETPVASGSGTLQLAWSGKQKSDAKVVLDRTDECYVSIALTNIGR